MEPMALGSPVGSPSQSTGSPCPSSTAYLPGFLLGESSAPSRIGVMTPDPTRFSHGGPSSPSSPGSHYGTPEFRINRQKAMFGASSSHTPQTETHVGGPPIRGLFESLDTKPSVTPSSPTSQNSSHNYSRVISNNVNSSFLDMQGSLNDMSHGLLQWVTVFGFPPSALNSVLSHISSRVRIIDKHPAPHAQSNWIHLKCTSEQESQRALACNGNIVSGSIMIGVIPCSDEGVILGSDKENRSKLNESVRLFSTPVKTPHVLQGSQNTNSPRTPVRIQNARPLVAGYNQHMSPQAVRTPENVPHKNTGIVTKAMEYVFGW